MRELSGILTCAVVLLEAGLVAAVDRARCAPMRGSDNKRMRQALQIYTPSIIVGRLSVITNHNILLTLVLLRHGVS